MIKSAENLATSLYQLSAAYEILNPFLLELYQNKFSPYLFLHQNYVWTSVNPILSRYVWPKLCKIRNWRIILQFIYIGTFWQLSQLLSRSCYFFNDTSYEHLRFHLSNINSISKLWIIDQNFIKVFLLNKENLLSQKSKIIIWH